MREHQFLSMNSNGSHRLAYTEWGDERNQEVLICSHGLTLNGRYFDWFAKAAQDQYRVICPDTVGRGNSDWIDPSLYWFEQYTADAVALLSRLEAPSVNWIGTSNGGLTGIALAAMESQPIKRLVLNDIGPFVPNEIIKAIADYIGKDERFDTHEEVEAQLRKLYPAFGELTKEQWGYLARVGSQMTSDGNMRLAYDPGVRQNYRSATDDLNIWDAWEKIDIPILILRGSESILLTQPILAEMLERNPNAQSHVFEGIGHAPPLMASDQINVVLDFLASN